MAAATSVVRARSCAPPSCACTPQDRDRIGVDDGDEVRVTSARGSLDARRCAPTPASRSAPRCWRSTCRRRRRGDARRRRRAGHRPPRGVAAMSASRARGRSAARATASTSRSCSIVDRSRSSSSSCCCSCSVMFYIWFMRKVIADMQNRIGPNERRTVRRPADARRRHQALLQGAVDPRHRRPLRVPARAVPLGPARVPRVLDHPDRRQGLDRRAPDLPPARRPARSACCSSSRCRASASTA